MRRGVLSVLWLAAIALAGLSACERQIIDPEAVALDLRRYLEAMKEVEPQQKAVFTAIEKVEKNHFVDDAYVAKTLKEVLPSFRDHDREIARFEPRTYDVETLHSRYVRAWEELEEGCKKVIAAMEDKDYVTLANARARMDAGKKQVLSAFALLDELLDAYERELEQTVPGGEGPGSPAGKPEART